MDDSLNKDAFDHLWLKYRYAYDDESTPSTDKADALRFLMGQMDYMKMTNISHAHEELLDKVDELQREYGSIVDHQKDGLNNYAVPILSLTENGQNDSKNWKCNIDADEVYEKYIVSLENKDYESALREQYDKYSTKLSTSKPISAKQYFDTLKMVSPLPVEDQFKGTNTTSSVRPLSESTKENYMRNDAPQQSPRSYNNYQFNNDAHHQSKQTTSKYTNQHLQGRGGSLGNPTSRPEATITSREPHRPSPDYSRSRGRGNYPWTRQPVNKSSTVNIRPELDSFKTASHQLAVNQMKKRGTLNRGHCYNPSSSLFTERDDLTREAPGSSTLNSYGTSRKCLGNRRPVSNKFVPPVRREEDDFNGGEYGGRTSRTLDKNEMEDNPYAELMQDDRLKNIEPKMVELIMNEIMDSGTTVTWDDIAGLELAKNTIQEIVVWPMLRPDIFTGLRGPPKGILLFGPPGTGKTMIGKCIASQSKSTFFSISASSLTSKWIGEGEKMVRALFAVARCHQPAVIFIDEIDSLLTQRSESEHESSRRIKTEFLVQLDGATTENEDRLLLVGATNRPQELDEAARRRLVKRLYIPLPDDKAREQIVHNLMSSQKHCLTQANIQEICCMTEGYSGADMANVCREAALGPIRSISFTDIQHIAADDVRAITCEDMKNALRSIRASVSNQDLDMYQEWNKKYGIYGR